MKILQVTSTFLQGGAEHFVVELSNEFVHQGFDCDTLTLFDVEEDNDLIKQLDPHINTFSLHKKPGLDISCYYKLYRFIKNGNYNVVHAHVGAIPYLLFSTLFLRKVKFVATIHSEAKREAGRYISKWNRLLMFHCGLCTPVTISEESKLSFEKYYLMKAPMVYNGISKYKKIEELQLHDNDNQLIFIHPASCQPVKNQELLFRAFSKLAKEFPNIKLLWMGSKNAYSDLFESLQEQMPSIVKYIGVVSNVRDYLVVADAMCLSSKMEGMPMTIIEAFSVGCPSLCTPVGGVVNMIADKKNGMLSADLEVDSYYTMLKQFCELSIEDRQMIRNNARDSFENYTIENCVKNYLGIYTL